MTDSGPEPAAAARVAEQQAPSSQQQQQQQQQPQPAAPEDDDNEIRPYRIHVSSKYLELTKRKLELTRLPHDVAEPKSKSDDAWWEPKPQVEPLIDFWLEHFSWRRQEASLNDALPQFRASLAVPGIDMGTGTSTPARARLHLVHAPSARPGAVPLLLLPPFPFTGLSLGHLVAPLTEPSPSENGDDAQPFHVVIPSLPGLGFSDALPGDAAAVPATAAMLNALMRRLGYDHYLVSNAGSAATGPAAIDWQIVNHLATRHAGSCVGAHLIDPPLAAPTARDAPLEWTRFAIARWFNSALFGYTTDDLAALARAAPAPPRTKTPSPAQLGLHHVGVLEPNTLAFALCDSPVGLLVLLLRSLRALGPRKDFSPEEVVTMAMLAWLPGPEAALRYWAHCATRPEAEGPAAATRPKVAVTVFLGEAGDAPARGAPADDVEMASLPTPVPHRYACPRWAGRRFDVVHAARASGEPGLLAWERPEIIVEGVVALARRLVKIDKRLRPAAAAAAAEEEPPTAPLQGVVTDGGPAKEPEDAPPAGATLKPPPMVQHTSSETRVGEGSDVDVASPKTRVTSPGTSPSPLPVKGE